MSADRHRSHGSVFKRCGRPAVLASLDSPAIVRAQENASRIGHLAALTGFADRSADTPS
jgi:hypothetical protein